MKRNSFLKLLSTTAFSSSLFDQNTQAQTLPTPVQSGAKIINVKPYIFKNALYVKVETDAGGGKATTKRLRLSVSL